MSKLLKTSLGLCLLVLFGCGCPEFEPGFEVVETLSEKEIGEMYSQVASLIEQRGNGVLHGADMPSSLRKIRAESLQLGPSSATAYIRTCGLDVAILARFETGENGRVRFTYRPSAIDFEVLRDWDGG